MGFLLDTHTLLWFLSGNNSISKKAKNTILNRKNKCYVSIASLWEIAIKIKLDKLSIDTRFKELSDLLHQNDIEILPITFEHICNLLDLEEAHRDPFDRIIISTAKTENISVITKDGNFKGYKNLEILW